MRGFLKSHSSMLQGLSHLLDPLVVFLGTYLIFFSFKDSVLIPIELVRVFSVYGPLLTFFVFPLFSIYRSWRGESLLFELKILAQAWIALIIIFNAIILVLANEEQLKVLWPYGLFRLQSFWLWTLGCYCMLVAVRLGGRVFFRLMRKTGYNKRKIIIIGAGDLGIQIGTSIMKQEWLGLDILGYFDDRKSEGAHITLAQNKAVSVLGLIDKAVPWALEYTPDIVLIALPMRAEKKINELIWQMGTNGIHVYLIPDLFAYGLQKASLQQLGGVPVMAFNLFPPWKRFFDIIFSLFILLIISPCLLLVAVLVKLEDGGPVFYGHKRIREAGKIFHCLKFRTMHVNADQRLEELLEQNPALQKEWEKSFKLKNDPRITKIGKFLRKTSLDELPQFLNVFKGEMSVVGARPIVNEELTKHYNTTAITYCAMKPGITGLWQVGKRSDTEDYKERVELDRWYILNASIGLDLKIILKTVFRIFNTKGAY